MSLSKIKKDRLEKLERLKKAGIIIYPIYSDRTHTCREAREGFEDLQSAEKEIYLTGRLRSIRVHGGSCFIDIEDGADKLQAYFKKDVLGEEKYNLFINNFDIGDFIQINGVLFLTKAGEKTLRVGDFKILAKAILPLPDDWYGLKDNEERYRKRYLDLIMNKEVKKKFEKRSQIIHDLRMFLGQEGFMEVETPILQDIPGGALAQPFKTHLNALNLDLYLRVAPELYLKRLLVGGFEKVFEIGRCFRNEGMDFSHNPDFTMLEFYWAYADYEQLMEMTERMFAVLIPELEIEYGGQKINFISPWKRISFETLFKEYCSMDVGALSNIELTQEAKKRKIKVEKDMPRFKILDEIYKKHCRPNIIQPTFVTNYPVEMSPLAKTLEDNSQQIARFQLLIAGLEIVNAYSELNDPIDQEKRFREQEAHGAKGEKDAHRYDKDFVEALSYGMPPAAGFGMGIDRLTLLLTNSHSVREVILFPTMKPKTKSNIKNQNAK